MSRNKNISNSIMGDIGNDESENSRIMRYLWNKAFKASVDASGDTPERTAPYAQKAHLGEEAEALFLQLTPFRMPGTYEDGTPCYGIDVLRSPKTIRDKYYRLSLAGEIERTSELLHLPQDKLIKVLIPATHSAISALVYPDNTVPLTRFAADGDRSHMGDAAGMRLTNVQFVGKIEEIDHKAKLIHKFFAILAEHLYLRHIGRFDYFHLDKAYKRSLVQMEAFNVPLQDIDKITNLSEDEKIERLFPVASLKEANLTRLLQNYNGGELKGKAREDVKEAADGFATYFEGIATLAIIDTAKEATGDSLENMLPFITALTRAIKMGGPENPSIGLFMLALDSPIYKDLCMAEENLLARPYPMENIGKFFMDQVRFGYANLATEAKKQFNSAEDYHDTLLRFSENALADMGLIPEDAVRECTCANCQRRKREAANGVGEKKARLRAMLQGKRKGR